MIYIHQMDGCAPTPLAHYLKALGIIRLVSEQVDQDARGWWDGDHFKLATKLSRAELEKFFIHEYKPTALISPWNKGSGFYTNKHVLDSLEHSDALRFSQIREAIQMSRKYLQELLQADKSIRNIKAESKKHGMSSAERRQLRTSTEYKNRLRNAEKEFARLKNNLIPTLRSKWRGGHREWLDAAIILTNDRTEFPVLLGSGGNDGRLDFTLNFMEMLNHVFNLKDGLPRDSSRAWFAASIWGAPTPQSMINSSVGQYLPGTSGGANNSNNPKSDSMVNPVDFILMLEGAVAFTSHATRRLGSSNSFRIASPFVVNSHGSAYASASDKDEKQKKEQWMPLWPHPSTYVELQHLLTEGRAQVDKRVVHEPLDMARAIKGLGTARGIGKFQRYGYLERNGQSNLAVPLGTMAVSNERSAYLSCLDDIDVWLRRLHRTTRSKFAPNRLISAEMQLTNRIFAVINDADTPQAWQSVLSLMGEMERLMACGSGFAAEPIPPLSPKWVMASNDNTVEFRLALAFALQSYTMQDNKQDYIRRHWIPLDSSDVQYRPRFAVSGTGSAERLDVRPEVVMRGYLGVNDAVALVTRRLVEAAQWGVRHLPLDAKYAWANISDLAALLSGNVNVDRILSLARPLMALDYGKMKKKYVPAEPRDNAWPDDAWIAIRLCTLPWKIKTRYGFELDVGTNPAIIRRLATGDATSAISLALRHLGAAGVRCTIRTATASASLSRLWAASLAFPISRKTAEKLLYRIDPNKHPFVE
ncbi:MAG: type I-U CRISPR-associated protein Csx17 [Cenarchaeum sp. SB0666_bin_15]|nr:type I-U CRISPR-associated protein Csx17 [Cenarchaeum sp. SB0666_bin_15]